MIASPTEAVYVIIIIIIRHCTCKPKPELDRLGTHLVCVCPKGKERFVTHASVALCIRDMAKAAGAYAKFENPDQFLWSLGQILPRLLRSHDEACGGVPRHPRSCHQPEGILARAGRLNSGPFLDESSWEGVMESQPYQR